MKRVFFKVLLLIVASLPVMAIEIINVKTRSVSGAKAQILLEFNGAPPIPKHFSIDDSAKMIFDFKGVKNGLQKNSSIKNLQLGVIRELQFADDNEKMRLIVDVTTLVPFSVDKDNNKIIINFENDIATVNKSLKEKQNMLNNFDFRRGEKGEGRIIVNLGHESVPIDIKEKNDTIIVEFRGATVPERLLRRFDVKDFGTPVQKVEIMQDPLNTVMIIHVQGKYDKIAYQVDKEYIVEVRSITEDGFNKSTGKQNYTGEKISLNFQNIEVRAVLQLMADFTGLNFVSSDSVQGQVTLRLEDIPWDQALDFVLKSKGLVKRKSGNLILIAPSTEIAQREQLELEALQQAESLAPLVSEFIQINYAKANELVGILKSSDNSMLSSRGQINVDDRTNTLLVKDTYEKIKELKKLLERLDVPVRQILIEAQVVVLKHNFSDDFGVHLDGAMSPKIGSYRIGVAPTMANARKYADDPGQKATTGSGFFNYAVNGTANLGLALARLPGGTLLDLELKASELESKSKILSRPRLLTLDKQTATIETGTQIPSQQVAQAGATPTISYKKAVLKLEVTPQVTPNNKISMELNITDDSPASGSDNVDTTSLSTNVMVDNGETIVLGGIFKIDKTNTSQRVPLLSSIPIFGNLFSNSSDSHNRNETVVFITPRIIDYTD